MPRPVYLATLVIGASIGVALLLIARSPAVVVVGYETVGWRRGAAMLERATR